MKAQSECSSVVCVVRIELYGSTTAVETCKETIEWISSEKSD